jgi:VanZ family protein
MLSAWPRVLDRFALRDLVVNVLLYFPLGIAACLSLRRGTPAAARFAFAAGIGAGLSTFVEFLQLFDATRCASAFDIACDLAGTLAGALAAIALAGPIEAALTRRSREFRTAPGAFALLGLWTLYQLYPVFPALGRHALFAKLAAFTRTPISPAALALATAQWLAVAVLLQVVFHRRASARMLLLGLLIPARLLVSGSGPSFADVVAFAAAFALSAALALRPGLRYHAAAAVLLGAITAYAFYPYRLAATPAPFSWVPFAALLNMDRQAAGLVFLRKTFTYGAAIGLLSLSGMSRRAATASVAALLLAIEFPQRWIPGHVPEISDPVLALLMATALWLLDHRYRHPETEEFG